MKRFLFPSILVLVFLITVALAGDAVDTFNTHRLENQVYYSLPDGPNFGEPRTAFITGELERDPVQGRLYQLTVILSPDDGYVNSDGTPQLVQSVIARHQESGGFGVWVHKRYTFARGR